MGGENNAQQIQPGGDKMMEQIHFGTGETAVATPWLLGNQEDDLDLEIHGCGCGCGCGCSCGCDCSCSCSSCSSDSTEDSNEVSNGEDMD